MSNSMDSEVSIKEKTITKFKRPKKWKIIFFNDDKTTMEYVTMVLVIIFKKTPEEAMSIMLDVHKNGSRVIGVYAKAQAETLIQEATDFKVAYNKKMKEMGEIYFSYLKIRMEEE